MRRKIVVLIGGMLLHFGCESIPAEVADTFLGATQSGDLAALATVSVVGWPGGKDQASDIEAWWVLQVTPSQVEPFQLEEWQRRLNAARAARDARLQETTEDEDAELERIQSRVDRLRGVIEREREEARKSVETWSSIDGLEGDVEVREAEVIVRSPRGDRRYALTLKRYRLSRPPDVSRIPSRWIVTAIEPVEG